MKNEKAPTTREIVEIVEGIDPDDGIDFDYDDAVTCIDFTDAIDFPYDS